MKATHWLLLDNLIKNYPHKTSISNTKFESAMDWAKKNGFIDKNTLRITSEGRGYFLLHQHETLENE